MHAPRVSAARRWVNANREIPATPSDHIWHLPELFADHGRLPVVLFARVSTHRQASDGNLAEILADLRQVALRHNIEIMGAFGEVGQGWRPLIERTELIKACDLARRCGAFVLVPSATRLLRHPHFHPFENQDVLPTVLQFCELVRFGHPAMFATALDPDMPWRDVRSLEIRRGKAAKGQPGGRPRLRVPGYKLRRRQEKLTEVLALHGANQSLGEIARAMRLPRSTIQDWLRKYR